MVSGVHTAAATACLAALLEHLPPHQPGLRLASPAHRLQQLAPLHALRARLAHQLLLDLLRVKVRARARARG